ncbi:MAG: hypothetical protein AAB388_04920 [Patescibacteria group bacterium]
MIVPIALGFITSSILFVALTSLYEMERRRGHRLFLSSTRARLDAFVVAVTHRCTRAVDHFVHFVVKLNWYYSVHSFLRSVLVFLGAVYRYFEHHFEHNRARTKELRREKQKQSTENHLSQMAAHKVETALTPAQKRRLKHKQLEGK